MKKFLVVFVMLMVIGKAQNLTNIWTSSTIDYSQYSGWVSFDKVDNTWQKRLYFIDTIKFQLMQPGFSTTVQYTYQFTEAERAAGEQIYSLGIDLTGDGKAEFYVLSQYGTTTSYRQGFRILDITTGQTVFQRDDQDFYYSYPVIADLDNDSKYELYFTKLQYPSFGGYVYEVYATNITGTAGEPGKVSSFSLKQNFPNPFNPRTSIEYTLDVSAPVQLEIFNIQGERVKLMTLSEQSAGTHTISWAGDADAGGRVPSGVYLYTLSAGGRHISKKMLLLK